MYRHYGSMMLLLSMTLRAGVCLAAIGKNEFLDYLEARDTSIGSYSLDVQRVNFKIPLGNYDRLREFVEKANEMELGQWEPNDVLDTLIRHVGAGDVYRLRRMVLERGERFKSTQTDNKSEGIRVWHYDGELYSIYSAIAGKHRAQWDIYPSVQQMGRGSLSDFGIGYVGTGKTWPKPAITAFEQRPDGILSVHQAVEDGVTYVAEYDPNLNLKYGYYREGGEKVQESWYLGHGEFGGYSVPRVHLQTWPEKDGHSVWCYVLGDVKMNCPISDADLALPQMPPWTIVMDYRHKPARQTQLMGYPREMLRDELMLDELGKAAAEATESAAGASVPQLETEPRDTEPKEQAPPDAQGKEPAPADSQKDQEQEDVKIVGSQTGATWPAILVVCIVVTAAGLAGVAVCRRRR